MKSHEIATAVKTLELRQDDLEALLETVGNKLDKLAVYHARAIKYKHPAEADRFIAHQEQLDRIWDILYAAINRKA